MAHPGSSKCSCLGPASGLTLSAQARPVKWCKLCRSAWVLDDELQAWVAELVKPDDARQMRKYPVSDLVNRRENEGLECGRKGRGTGAGEVVVVSRQSGLAPLVRQFAQKASDVPPVPGLSPSLPHQGANGEKQGK